MICVTDFIQEAASTAIVFVIFYVAASKMKTSAGPQKQVSAFPSASRTIITAIVMTFMVCAAFAAVMRLEYAMYDFLYSHYPIGDVLIGRVINPFEAQDAAYKIIETIGELL